MLRPATARDLDVVTAYAAAEEKAWFGVLEFSPAEIAEIIGHFGGVDHGVVAVDGDEIRGFVIISLDGDTLLVANPDDPDPPYDALLGWLLEHGGRHLEAYAGDARRIAALEARGWSHLRSSFTMERGLTPPLEVPQWPAGLTVTAYDAATEAREVHHLVYVDAAWASVPGHTERGFEGWNAMTSTPDQVAFVARRDGRAVGWVVGRLHDEGRAWIYQIAVATGERGHGLGRALVLHCYAALLPLGPASLGLNVSAVNANALGLYRSVGLEVTREWRTFTPPDPR